MTMKYFRVEIHYSIKENLKGAIFKNLFCSTEELPFKANKIISRLEGQHPEKTVHIQKIILNNKHDITDSVINLEEIPQLQDLRKNRTNPQRLGLKF
jgi:hypothetical protein